MPRYFVGIVEDQAPYAESGAADFDQVMAAHRSFSDAVRAAGGTVVAGDALQPVATATFLRGTRTADVARVDNPLPEVKEVLGGYYVIDVADDATAATLAAQCPAPYGYIELRPVWDLG